MGVRRVAFAVFVVVILVDMEIEMDRKKKNG